MNNFHLFKNNNFYNLVYCILMKKFSNLKEFEIKISSTNDQRAENVNIY